MQLTAANLDLDAASKNYQLSLRNSIGALSGGALLALVLAWIIIRGAMKNSAPTRQGLRGSRAASHRATCSSRFRRASTTTSA